MSAFICKEKTFGTIYSGLRAFNNGRYPSTKYAIAVLLDYVQTLNPEVDTYRSAVAHFYNLNVRAVNQRYCETISEKVADEDLTKFTLFDLNVSRIAFFKSLECLQYQMSEGDIPNQKAYSLIEKLISAIAEDFVHSSKEYEMEDWD